MEAVKQTITTQSNTNTFFFNTQNDQKSKDFLNVITYEFNADETRLLVFYTKTGYIQNDPFPRYQLIDITSNTELKTFDDVQFAYFEQPDLSQPEKLIIIDTQGQIIEYDPGSGITYLEKQKQEREAQARAEKLKKEQEEREQKKLAEEKLQQEQKEKEEAEDKEKQERFAKLSPEEQKKLPLSELPKKEREEREKFRLESVIQVGKEIVSGIKTGITQQLSDFAKGFGAYFWPTALEPVLSPEGAFKLVTEDIAAIQESQHPALELSVKEEKEEEVSSPAIIEEKQKPIQDRIISLVRHATLLDKTISLLNPAEWPSWQEKQEVLLEPAKSVISNSVKQIIKNTWETNGSKIINLASQVALAGMTSAAITFTYQATQIATGNLETVSINTLLIAGLTAASANLIATTGKLLFDVPVAQTALSATGSNVLSQTLIAPSITQFKRYQLTLPSLFTGAIKSWIIGEAIATVQTMFEQNGEIAQTIKNIDVKSVLFGKELTPASNALVETTVPHLQKVIINEKVSLALTEIGWIFLQSAALGGLFWSIGLGYADTSLAESLSYSVLAGVAQGSLAALATLTNSTSPGVILTIAAVPLSQQLLAITGTDIVQTSQTITTGVIQAVATEVTNLVINESEKSGGLYETLKKGSAALGSAISSRWSNLWSNIGSALETLQEIEPIPL